MKNVQKYKIHKKCMMKYFIELVNMKKTVNHQQMRVHEQYTDNTHILKNTQKNLKRLIQCQTNCTQIKQ